MCAWKRASVKNKPKKKQTKDFQCPNNILKSIFICVHEITYRLKASKNNFYTLSHPHTFIWPGTC